MNNSFQKCYCVNLDRREDRWGKFTAGIPNDWPFAPIQRVRGIDGQKVPAPDWWKAGKGAWGCYRSHLHILEQALNQGIDSLLLLEDDALFPEDFTPRVLEFLAHVPGNWGMLYFGGQHLFVNRTPPREVNPWVYQPYNVNRTHAFALRGPMIRKVYQHLNRKDWHSNQHIDHHLGRLHQRREDPIYCPKEWLVGQAGGKSNISGRTPDDRFWKPAQTLASIKPEEQPFFAILGLHSSGSSCLAGVLYHLGLHLGNELVGYHGKPPINGGEALGLLQLCEAAIPFPKCEIVQRKGKVWGALSQWLNARRREAAEKKTIAAGKYPQLCRLGQQLWNLCGSNLRVLDIQRPIEDSIASIIKRCPQKNPRELEDHQRWLQAGKEELLAKLGEHQVLPITYADLLNSPRETIAQVVGFIGEEGYVPTDSQVANAVGYVDPALCHIAPDTPQLHTHTTNPAMEGALE